MKRQYFLQQTAKAIAGAYFSPAILELAATKPTLIKAVAFDAYALFDTRPILDLAEQLFPAKGAELMLLWRTRQFEYTWLRVIEKRYCDFWKITGDALAYAAANLHIDLSSGRKESLLQAVQQMEFVPAGAAVVRQLKDWSIQLAILSNATPGMLQSAISRSNLEGIFDFVLSTHAIKTYKPDPAAYQLAITNFKVLKEQILFVVFGGWDAAGAKSFGYRTAWVNSSGLPPEELDVVPDFTCKNISAIPAYIKAINQ